MELVKKIDIHVHTVSSRGIPRPYNGNTFCLPEELIAMYEKLGIEKGVISPILKVEQSIELNTNRGNEPLPNAHWLKMYRELGGEIVTMGSDTHTTKHISYAMEARQELLESCGFKYFTTFAEKKPIFHKL